MAVPLTVNDGDFTIPQEDGNAVPSFPFAYRGDNKSFVMRVTKRIQVNYYQPPIAMSQRDFEGLGIGYLVDFGQPTGIGQGLISWQEVYASVPLTGTEYGTATYTVQIPTINEYGVDSSINSYVDTFDAKFVFEYSRGAPLPQILFPHLQLARTPENNNALTVQLIGDRNAGVAGDPDNVLAQNTNSGIYMGQIFFRRKVFIKPSFPVILQQIIPPPP